MTRDMMALRGLLRKSGDPDLSRAMIGFAAGRLMALEAGADTGAAPGEKSPTRLARRNGYRDRTWEIRAGRVEPRIPRLRTGLFSKLPGAAPDGGEGADSGGPGSLYPGRRHPPGR